MAMPDKTEARPLLVRDLEQAKAARAEPFYFPDPQERAALEREWMLRAELRLALADAEWLREAQAAATARARAELENA